MGVLLLVSGVVLVGWAVLLGRKHIAEHHALERYRFENRGAGGIQFSDYDESVAFRKREMRQAMRGKVFVGALVVGVFCVLGAVVSLMG